MAYAVANGADIINASYAGFSFFQPAEPDAVNAAYAAGTLTVAGADNNGRDIMRSTPANIATAVAVAASTPADGVAPFSNFGRALDLTAPGQDILSTRAAKSGGAGGYPLGGDYLRLSGTSMAAPHTSGLAALVMSALPAITLDEVRWHLELSALQPGWPGFEGKPWNPFYGWGRIDAAGVFADVPATTRLRRPAFALPLAGLEVHGYAARTLRMSRRCRWS